MAVIPRRRADRSGSGALTAVADLDLAVEGREIFGFLGRTGAGKTTTGCCSMPSAPPAGSPGARGPGRDPEICRRIGVLPADLHFDARLTGRDLLRHVGRLREDRSEPRSTSSVRAVRPRSPIDASTS